MSVHQYTGNQTFKTIWVVHFMNVAVERNMRSVRFWDFLLERGGACLGRAQLDICKSNRRHRRKLQECTNSLLHRASLFWSAANHFYIIPTLSGASMRIQSDREVIVEGWLLARNWSTLTIHWGGSPCAVTPHLYITHTDIISFDRSAIRHWSLILVPWSLIFLSLILILDPWSLIFDPWLFIPNFDPWSLIPHLWSFIANG